MDEYLSVIKLFALSYTPQGYLPCEGQALPINQNEALYSLLRNQFGGEFPHTFCLPDLRGKEPIPNTQYYICVNGVYPSRY